MVSGGSFNALKEMISSSYVASVTSSEIETTRDLIKVKLHLPNEAPRKVQIYADFNGWQAVEMFCEKQVWQVALPRKYTTAESYPCRSIAKLVRW